MNSYQLHKAVLFWAPRWAAACTRVFLDVQNDKTLQVLFCIWQCFQWQLHCSTVIAFPSLPLLHKLTRLKFASVLLFITLPPVAGEYSLGGKTILIVSDVHIKTQLVAPYRPARVVMSSLGSIQPSYQQRFLSCLIHSALTEKYHCRSTARDKQKPLGTSPRDRRMTSAEP